MPNAEDQAKAKDLYEKSKGGNCEYAKQLIQGASDRSKVLDFITLKEVDGKPEGTRSELVQAKRESQEYYRSYEINNLKTLHDAQKELQAHKVAFITKAPHAVEAKGDTVPWVKGMRASAKTRGTKASQLLPL